MLHWYKTCMKSPVQFLYFIIKLLWPCNSIWRHGTVSSLVQVMKFQWNLTWNQLWKHFISKEMHLELPSKCHPFSLTPQHAQCDVALMTPYHLTHWGRDKMADIFQTTFSNAFSWMTMLEFRLRFDWSLFPRVHYQYSSIGSDNGLAPIRRQAIIWTNDGCFTNAYMRHSASMS